MAAPGTAQRGRGTCSPALPRSGVWHGRCRALAALAGCGRQTPLRARRDSRGRADGRTEHPPRRVAAPGAYGAVMARGRSQPLGELRPGLLPRVPHLRALEFHRIRLWQRPPVEVLSCGGPGAPRTGPGRGEGVKVLPEGASHPCGRGGYDPQPPQRINAGDSLQLRESPVGFRGSRPPCVRALLGGDWELAVLLRRSFPLRSGRKRFFPLERAKCQFLSWMMGCKRGFSLPSLAVLSPGLPIP